MTTTLSRFSQHWWILSALSFVVVCLFFKDFGVAWDDPLQAQYGELLVAYYASMGTDDRFMSLADLRYYGGAFEIVAQLAAQFSPWSPYETRRLLGGLVGALGVLGCGALGSLIGGRGIAWLSATFLATWPVWVGHAFINSKDVPFAAAYVWAVYFLTRIAKDDRVRPAHHAGFAVAAGLAMGIRVFGLFLLGLYACLLARAALQTIRAGSAPVARKLLTQALAFGLAGTGSWLLMMLGWPWTHGGPIERPFEAARLMTRFPRPMEILFDGQVMVTTRLPWSYAPTWLAATLSPLVVILLLILVPLLLLRLKKRPQVPSAAAAILLVCGSLPLLAAVTGRVVLYDGIRQLLFIGPLLMVAAAWSAVELLKNLASTRTRLLAVAAGVILSLDPVAGLVRLHPYQYIYFNQLVGGLKGAAGRFETDYWGLGLREAAEWVNQNQLLLKSRGGLKVFIPHNCGEPTSAGAYLDPRVRLTDNNLAGDYVLAPTRFGCDKSFNGTAVFTVRREGVPLVVVKMME